MVSKVEITKTRLRSLESAEALAQAVRDAFAHNRPFASVYPWLDQWMRHTGGSVVYQKPKKPYKVWCCECRKNHVAGECRNR